MQKVQAAQTPAFSRKSAPLLGAHTAAPSSEKYSLRVDDPIAGMISKYGNPARDTVSAPLLLMLDSRPTAQLGVPCSSNVIFRFRFYPFNSVFVKRTAANPGSDQGASSVRNLSHSIRHVARGLALAHSLCPHLCPQSCHSFASSLAPAVCPAFVNVDHTHCDPRLWGTPALPERRRIAQLRSRVNPPLT